MSKRVGKKPGRFFLWIAGLVLGVGVRLQAAEDNAALDYWKAAAVMGVPQSREELSLVQFIDNELFDLPPVVLAARLDAARWLLREKTFNASVASGARRQRCSFYVSVPGSPFLKRDHLPVMEAVTRRLLATVKAYEFAGNTTTAAGILRDLLALIVHLDQDADLVSLGMAADFLQWQTSAAESLLSRDPPVEAVSILDTFFEGARPRLFLVGKALRDESDRFGEWFINSSLPAQEQLALFYASDSERPGIDRLLPLEAETKLQLLADWVAAYREHMTALADAADLPYRQGHARFLELDALREQEERMVAAGGGNPLIPLLAPAMTDVFDRLTLAEGQYRACALLCRSARKRSISGAWPATVTEIPPYSEGPPFSDPFSGEPLHYQRVQFQPRVTVRVPRWMATDQRFLYRYDLAARRADDARRGEEAIKRIQAGTTGTEEGRENLDQPVPR